MIGQQEKGNQVPASRWQRLISYAFRLLYRELARTYDGVAWLVSFGQWRAWGEAALPHLEGKNILELGYGPGHLQVALFEQGFRPVGLDASPQMTRIAQQRLKRSGLEPMLVQGQAQRLPFPKYSYDCLVATFPTDYITAPETLGEIARILRPKGRLVVVLGARLTGQDPVSRFVEWVYLITGQRETINTDDWKERFTSCGLSAQWFQIEMARSEVSLLIAKRMPHSP